jgi:hypothetical protein
MTYLLLGVLTVLVFLSIPRSWIGLGGDGGH